jgi:hypothetical protein
MGILEETEAVDQFDKSLIIEDDVPWNDGSEGELGVGVLPVANGRCAGFDDFPQFLLFEGDLLLLPGFDFVVECVDIGFVLRDGDMFLPHTAPFRTAPRAGRFSGRVD